MSNVYSVGAWVLGAVAGFVVVKFFVLPWIAPLYARYKEWVAAVASGTKK